MSPQLTVPPPSAMDKLADRVMSNPFGFGVAYLLLKSITTENMRSIECAFGLFAITAGFWMGWPLHMEYATENPMYLALARHFPSWAWTLIFLIVGVPAFIGCNRKGRFLTYFCVPKRPRIFCAFLSLWTWTFISGVFIADQAPGLATVWAPIVAGYQLRILLWLWLNPNINNDSPACSNP